MCSRKSIVSGREAVLMLIGRGEMESVIRRKVNRRGLQDVVLFLGNRRKIERYYQAMDAFVLPVPL